MPVNFRGKERVPEKVEWSLFYGVIFLSARLKYAGNLSRGQLKYYFHVALCLCFPLSRTRESIFFSCRTQVACRLNVTGSTCTLRFVFY